MQLEFDFSPTLTVTPVIDGKEYRIHVSELESEKDIYAVLQLYDNLRRELAQNEYERRKLTAATVLTKQQLMSLSTKYIVEKYNIDVTEKEEPNE